ncbi:MAG: diguanylate cyclase [Bacillota bacterium]
MRSSTVKRLDGRNRIILIITAFLLVVLIGYLRYVSGPDYAFSLFYLFPICLVGWFIGRWAGILFSVISVITWLAADLAMTGSYKNPSVPIINESLRFVVFLILTVVLTELKMSLDREKLIARTDSLTRIANRRAFYENAAVEIKRARRYKYPLTIVSMDVDNFKIINDNLGHQAGDTLLMTVANTIKKDIRASDMVARLGGDEFAILLPETDPALAGQVIGRLRDELLEVMNRNGWPVTFSIGIVTFEGGVGSIDEMVQKADNLMYTVKQEGKNMIRHEVIAWESYPSKECQA